MVQIVVGDEKLPLVKAIVDGVEAEVLSLETGKFADTEWYVQFHDVSKIKGASVFVVGQFEHISRGIASRQNSISDQLMHVLFLAHQVKLHGAGRVVALLPYLPYARQCKDVKSEHPGPFDAVGKLCAAVGIDHIVACEIHEELCLSVLPVPLHTIGCELVWQKVLKRELSAGVESICLVSPDKGGVERVKRVAQLLDVPWAFVTKRRIGHDASVALELQGEEVAERTVVLIDDIVDTGITVVQACEKALEHGAKRVVGCFVHPVLSPGAVARLEESAIEMIWVCNTILLDTIELGKKFSVVSINDLVVEYVRTIV